MICVGFLLEIDTMETQILGGILFLLCVIVGKSYVNPGVDAPSHGRRGVPLPELGNPRDNSGTPPRGTSMQRDRQGSLQGRRVPTEIDNSTIILNGSTSSEECTDGNSDKNVWVLKQFYGGIGEEECDNLSNYSVK